MRPLLRLPAVIFPHQPVSLTKKSAGVAAESFAVSEEQLQCAWLKHDGCLATFGPGSRIGVLCHVLFDQVLEAAVPTPDGVAHAIGGQRVRLARMVRGGEEGKAGPALCELSLLEDEELTAPRLERLGDEAEAARRLIDVGLERGLFSLESSALDEELGGRSVADPRCHPMWSAEAANAADVADKELSLWLGARLPLTTELRAQILSTLCPLRRMQDVVDALRLLCDPQRPRGSGYKFKLILSHPATDMCGTIRGDQLAPRAVVALAPPSYTNWTSNNAFPHG